MNYRVIYIILFVCLPTIWAQKAKGFPAAETDIYKIIKVNNNQKDSLLYVGSGKNEVMKALGQPNGISRNDDNNGDDWGYDDGLTIWYLDNYPDSYDGLMINPNNDGSLNPYILSKKYKLGIGRPIPKELLDSFEYRVYNNTSNKPMSPAEDAALPKAAWRQYSFHIAVLTGELTDASFVINVQDGKIIKIYLGYPG